MRKPAFYILNTKVQAPNHFVWLYSVVFVSDLVGNLKTGFVVEQLIFIGDKMLRVFLNDCFDRP